VGFPAVIKPIHGAASLGVLRVDSQPALAAAYEKVRASLVEIGCLYLQHSIPTHLPEACCIRLMLRCSALARSVWQVCLELAATIIENGVVRQATPAELANAKV
jgi:hypothetical protein